VRGLQFELKTEEMRFGQVVDMRDCIFGDNGVMALCCA
jgi:hypothetical protein